MKQIYVTERNTMVRENACRNLTKGGIFQTKYSSYPAADCTNKKRNAEMINNHLTQEHKIVGWSNLYVNIQYHVLYRINSRPEFIRKHQNWGAV